MHLRNSEKEFCFKEFIFHLANNQLASKTSSVRKTSRNTIFFPKLVNVTIDGNKKQRGSCFVCNSDPIEGVGYKQNSYIRAQCECHSVFLHDICNIAFHNPGYKAATKIDKFNNNSNNNELTVNF
ncbi:hypothetical protein DICPUDRAFT_83127 [Dictyostelium purpureum]|uniref:Uncharacterized protein n=1 Tax=Dictyostelium purpureum TaxID=5786 RepID=F0ZYM2_DICPU|nr:uncharacterized protein DICPUDRAFT_83127 [Dictyostelium purpureum]EGC30965.1 hypothetical protein DICPUDRAFT_83127 [Dictyostelium purpureum]|eukprot:XP_003292516.1 hypothetical protein DICPUDRAFT_83127 [Dictyostelium purpureum]